MLSSDRNETRGHTAAISRDMAEAKSYIPALGSGVNTSPTDHGRPANRMEELHHLYPQVFNRLHRRQMLSAEQSPLRSVFNHRMSRVQSHHEGGGDEVCGRGGEEYGAKVASRKSRRKRYFIGEFTGFVEDPLQVPSTDSSSVEIPKPFEDAAGDTGRTRSKHRHWPFNTSVPHHSIVEDEPSVPQYAQSRKFISGLYDESCEPSCADESIATLNYPSNKGQDDEISRLLSYSDSSSDESAAVRLPSVDSALDGTLGDSQDLTEDAGKPADVKQSGRRSSGQWGVQDEKEDLGTRLTPREEGEAQMASLHDHHRHHPPGWPMPLPVSRGPMARHTMGTPSRAAPNPFSVPISHMYWPWSGGPGRPSPLLHPVGHHNISSDVLRSRTSSLSSHASRGGPLRADHSLQTPRSANDREIEEINARATARRHNHTSFSKVQRPRSAQIHPTHFTDLTDDTDPSLGSPEGAADHTGTDSHVPRPGSARRRVYRIRRPQSAPIFGRITPVSHRSDDAGSGRSSTQGDESPRVPLEQIIPVQRETKQTGSSGTLQVEGGRVPKEEISPVQRETKQAGSSGTFSDEKRRRDDSPLQFVDEGKGTGLHRQNSIKVKARYANSSTGKKSPESGPQKSDILDISALSSEENPLHVDAQGTELADKRQVPVNAAAANCENSTLANEVVTDSQRDLSESQSSDAETVDTVVESCVVSVSKVNSGDFEFESGRVGTSVSETDIAVGDYPISSSSQRLDEASNRDTESQNCVDTDRDNSLVSTDQESTRDFEYNGGVPGEENSLQSSSGHLEEHTNTVLGSRSTSCLNVGAQSRAHAVHSLHSASLQDVSCLTTATAENLSRSSSKSTESASHSRPTKPKRQKPAKAGTQKPSSAKVKEKSRTPQSNLQSYTSKFGSVDNLLVGLDAETHPSPKKSKTSRLKSWFTSKKGRYNPGDESLPFIATASPQASQLTAPQDAVVYENQTFGPRTVVASSDSNTNMEGNSGDGDGGKVKQKAIYTKFFSGPVQEVTLQPDKSRKLHEGNGSRQNSVETVMEVSVSGTGEDGVTAHRTVRKISLPGGAVYHQGPLSPTGTSPSKTLVTKRVSVTTIPLTSYDRSVMIGDDGFSEDEMHTSTQMVRATPVMLKHWTVSDTSCEATDSLQAEGGGGGPVQRRTTETFTMTGQRVIQHEVRRDSEKSEIVTTSSPGPSSTFTREGGDVFATYSNVDGEESQRTRSNHKTASVEVIRTVARTDSHSSSKSPNGPAKVMSGGGEADDLNQESPDADGGTTAIILPLRGKEPSQAPAKPKRKSAVLANEEPTSTDAAKVETVAAGEAHKKVKPSDGEDASRSQEHDVMEHVITVHAHSTPALGMKVRSSSDSEPDDTRPGAAYANEIYENTSLSSFKKDPSPTQPGSSTVVYSFKGGASAAGLHADSGQVLSSTPGNHTALQARSSFKNGGGSLQADSCPVLSTFNGNPSTVSSQYEQSHTPEQTVLSSFKGGDVDLQADAAPVLSSVKGNSSSAAGHSAHSHAPRATESNAKQGAWLENEHDDTSGKDVQKTDVGAVEEMMEVASSAQTCLSAPEDMQSPQEDKKTSETNESTTEKGPEAASEDALYFILQEEGAGEHSPVQSDVDSKDRRPDSPESFSGTEKQKQTAQKLSHQQISVESQHQPNRQAETGASPKIDITIPPEEINKAGEEDSASDSQRTAATATADQPSVPGDTEDGSRLSKPVDERVRKSSTGKPARPPPPPPPPPKAASSTTETDSKKQQVAASHSEEKKASHTHSKLREKFMRAFSSNSDEGSKKSSPKTPKKDSPKPTKKEKKQTQETSKEEQQKDSPKLTKKEQKKLTEEKFKEGATDSPKLPKKEAKKLTKEASKEDSKDSPKPSKKEQKKLAEETPNAGEVCPESPRKEPEKTDEVEEDKEDPKEGSTDSPKLHHKSHKETKKTTEETHKDDAKSSGHHNPLKEKPQKAFKWIKKKLATKTKRAPMSKGYSFGADDDDASAQHSKSSDVSGTDSDDDASHDSGSSVDSSDEDTKKKTKKGKKKAKQAHSESDSDSDSSPDESSSKFSWSFGRKKEAGLSVNDDPDAPSSYKKKAEWSPAAFGAEADMGAGSYKKVSDWSPAGYSAVEGVGTYKKKSDLSHDHKEQWTPGQRKKSEERAGKDKDKDGMKGKPNMNKKAAPDELAETDSKKSNTDQQKKSDHKDDNENTKSETKGPSLEKEQLVKEHFPAVESAAEDKDVEKKPGSAPSGHDTAALQAPLAEKIIRKQDSDSSISSASDGDEPSSPSVTSHSSAPVVPTHPPKSFSNIDYSDEESDDEAGDYATLQKTAVAEPRAATLTRRPDWTQDEPQLQSPDMEQDKNLRASHGEEKNLPGKSSKSGDKNQGHSESGGDDEIQQQTASKAEAAKAELLSLPVSAETIVPQTASKPRVAVRTTPEVSSDKAQDKNPPGNSSKTEDKQKLDNTSRTENKSQPGHSGKTEDKNYGRSTGRAEDGSPPGNSRDTEDKQARSTSGGHGEIQRQKAGTVQAVNAAVSEEIIVPQTASKPRAAARKTPDTEDKRDAQRIPSVDSPAPKPRNKVLARPTSREGDTGRDDVILRREQARQDIGDNSQTSSAPPGQKPIDASNRVRADTEHTEESLQKTEKVSSAFKTPAAAKRSRPPSSGPTATAPEADVDGLNPSNAATDKRTSNSGNEIDTAGRSSSEISKDKRNPQSVSEVDSDGQSLEHSATDKRTSHRENEVSESVSRGEGKAEDVFSTHAALKRDLRLLGESWEEADEPDNVEHSSDSLLEEIDRAFSQRGSSSEYSEPFDSFTKENSTSLEATPVAPTRETQTCSPLHSRDSVQAETGTSGVFLEESTSANEDSGSVELAAISSSGVDEGVVSKPRKLISPYARTEFTHAKPASIKNWSASGTSDRHHHSTPVKTGEGEDDSHLTVVTPIPEYSQVSKSTPRFSDATMLTSFADDVTMTTSSTVPDVTVTEGESSSGLTSTDFEPSDSDLYEPIFFERSGKISPAPKLADTSRQASDEQQSATTTVTVSVTDESEMPEIPAKSVTRQYDDDVDNMYDVPPSRQPYVFPAEKPVPIRMSYVENKRLSRTFALQLEPEDSITPYATCQAFHPGAKPEVDLNYVDDQDPYMNEPMDEIPARPTVRRRLSSGDSRDGGDVGRSAEDLEAKTPGGDVDTDVVYDVVANTEQMQSRTVQSLQNAPQHLGKDCEHTESTVASNQVELQSQSVQPLQIVPHEEGTDVEECESAVASNQQLQLQSQTVESVQSAHQQRENDRVQTDSTIVSKEVGLISEETQEASDPTPSKTSSTETSATTSATTSITSRTRTLMTKTVEAKETRSESHDTGSVKVTAVKAVKSKDRVTGSHPSDTPSDSDTDSSSDAESDASAGSHYISGEHDEDMTTTHTSQIKTMTHSSQFKAGVKSAIGANGETITDSVVTGTEVTVASVERRGKSDDNAVSVGNYVKHRETAAKEGKKTATEVGNTSVTVTDATGATGSDTFAEVGGMINVQTDGRVAVKTEVNSEKLDEVSAGTKDASITESFDQSVAKTGDSRASVKPGVAAKPVKTAAKPAVPVSKPVVTGAKPVPAAKPGVPAGKPAVSAAKPVPAAKPGHKTDAEIGGKTAAVVFSRGFAHTFDGNDNEASDASRIAARDETVTEAKNNETSNRVTDDANSNLEEKTAVVTSEETGAHAQDDVEVSIVHKMSAELNSAGAALPPKNAAKDKSERMEVNVSDRSADERSPENESGGFGHEDSVAAIKTLDAALEKEVAGMNWPASETPSSAAVPTPVARVTIHGAQKQDSGKSESAVREGAKSYGASDGEETEEEKREPTKDEMEPETYDGQESPATKSKRTEAGKKEQAHSAREMLGKAPPKPPTADKPKEKTSQENNTVQNTVQLQSVSVDSTKAGQHETTETSRSHAGLRSEETGESVLPPVVGYNKLTEKAVHVGVENQVKLKVRPSSSGSGEEDSGKILDSESDDKDNTDVDQESSTAGVGASLSLQPGTVPREMYAHVMKDHSADSGEDNSNAKGEKYPFTVLIDSSPSKDDDGEDTGSNNSSPTVSEDKGTSLARGDNHESEGDNSVPVDEEDGELYTEGMSALETTADNGDDDDGDEGEEVDGDGPPLPDRKYKQKQVKYNEYCNVIRVSSERLKNARARSASVSSLTKTNSLDTTTERKKKMRKAVSMEGGLDEQSKKSKKQRRKRKKSDDLKSEDVKTKKHFSLKAIKQFFKIKRKKSREEEPPAGEEEENVYEIVDEPEPKASKGSNKHTWPKPVRKKNSHPIIAVDSSHASSDIRPIGRLLQLNADGTQLLELIRPPNGNLGIELTEGNEEFENGIFVSGFVDNCTEKLLSGILSLGDQILKINEYSVQHSPLDHVHSIISSQQRLKFLVNPASS